MCALYRKHHWILVPVLEWQLFVINSSLVTIPVAYAKEVYCSVGMCKSYQIIVYPPTSPLSHKIDLPFVHVLRPCQGIISWSDCAAFIDVF